MSDQESDSGILEHKLDQHISRRRLLTLAAGVTGAAVAGAGLTSTFAAGNKDNTSGDTAAQVFTAALIAEDLATTFYYTGLTTPAVIQDPQLAGPGGSANMVSASGNAGNVNYLQAALDEEIHHANLLRSLVGLTASTSDPVQTFYYPAGTFSNLSNFLGVLNALENAFIGAYLAAIREFAQMAADTRAGSSAQMNSANHPYTSGQLEYFSQVAGSILGVESEHRALGRVISNSNPANNVCYEQQDGITTVYNGSSSAVHALTPFLSGTPGSGYSLQTALAGSSAVIGAFGCTGGIPSY